jgi:hypothetical protein
LQEKVYDVSWGDAQTRKPDANGKLPPVGSETVLEHQRVPVTLDPVMNSNALVDRIWHFGRLPLPQLRPTLHSVLPMRVRLPI